MSLYGSTKNAATFKTESYRFTVVPSEATLERENPETGRMENKRIEVLLLFRKESLRQQQGSGSGWTIEKYFGAPKVPENIWII